MDDRAERKVVSVLFADLVGFTARAEQLDPEDVRRMLVPYYSRVRVELERFGGTVEKFIGDAVMALFGAPLSHEDDPERAVRAAFAVREAVMELNNEEELDLHVRIAVNTGEVVVSPDIQPLAAGDVVNTASRLQGAAPEDGILVSAATRAATWDAVEYRAAVPLQLKGKAAPVAAWEAVSLTRHERTPRALAPLVGRRVELRVLIDALERARRGEPQLVTLVGEPGIGKSRLIWELFHAVQLDREPAAWRYARCAAYGGGAFSMLAQVIKTEAGILDTHAPRTAAAKLRNTLRALPLAADEAKWIGTHVRPLIGLSGQAARADTRSEAFAAWRRLLEAVAERDLLVVALEDLHWADDALLDFVEHLAEWARGRIVVVCSARSDFLERRPAWPGTLLQLRPLARDDAGLLLRLLVGDPVDEALLDQVGGNPLFAEEYARILVEQGTPALPSSVQAVIAARLDALPPVEKDVVHEAAVVGRVFWPDAVRIVGGHGPGEVEERLRALEARQLMRPHRRSAVEGELQYAFSHVLVRDVAYEQITRERRADLHARAVQWIESLERGRAEERAEMLAHHYERALDYGRAVEHLHEPARKSFREAGDRALALYAFGAAARWYWAALDLWPAADRDWPHLLLCYGKALFRAKGGGEEVLTEARDALLAAGDRESACEAEVMLTRLLLARGDTGVLEAAQRAAALVADAGPSYAKADALSNLARFLELAGRAPEALEAGRSALELADTLGLDELRASALYAIGCARTSLGDLDGIHDVERSIEITDKLNSPESVRGYANLASVLANVGDLDRAWKVYAEARRIAERFADVRGLRWLAVEAVFEHYWRGEWEQALAGADSFLAEADAGVESYMNFGCWYVRASIRLARGDSAGALADSARALDAARRVKDPQALYPLLGLRARLLTASGRLQEAGMLVDELLGLWAAGGFQLPSFWISDAALALSDLGRGSEFAGAAVQARGATRWLEAAQLVATGAFAEAAGRYGEIGAVPEEAQARLRAARAHAAEGKHEESHRELQHALDLYRGLGADVSVAQALPAGVGSR